MALGARLDSTNRGLMLRALCSAFTSAGDRRIWCRGCFLQVPAGGRSIGRAGSRTGRHLLDPPFNHEQVIAGQGTAAYEALTDLNRDGENNIDAIFAHCGGGGILSGTLISARAQSPKTLVIGAEPLNANDAAQSLRSGHICQLSKPPTTLADGAMTRSVGRSLLSILNSSTMTLASGLGISAPTP